MKKIENKISILAIFNVYNSFYFYLSSLLVTAMLKKASILFIFLLTIANITFAGYIDKKNIPEKKQTKAGLYLNAADTYELMQKKGGKILFIDVRTPSEVAWLGMPNIADANIPFKLTDKKYQWDEKRKNFKLNPNPDFVSGVVAQFQKKGLTKSDKVIVMCRSGKRSAQAADALTAAGFSQVVSVIDGFEGDKASSGDKKGQRTVNGWKNSNLPWSYTLDKEKMFLSQYSKDRNGKKSKMLKKMDADSNGVISKVEFDQHHEKMFGKIDQNNDGKLNEQELKEFKESRKKEKEKQNITSAQ